MIGMLSACDAKLPNRWESIRGEGPTIDAMGISNYESQIVQESIRDAGPDPAVPQAGVPRSDPIAAGIGPGNGPEARSRRGELSRIRTSQRPEGPDHGADSGIGRAAAIAFAREGADIALNYLRREAGRQGGDRPHRESGHQGRPLPGDIQDEAFCKKLVEDARKALGGLDILVNVAGHQIACESIADLTTEQFDETFKTNVYAMFWLCKAALPHMPAGATIINTASIVAYQPSKQLLDYSSTKAAIVAFTKPWPSRSPRRASASTPWPPDRSGRRSSRAAASRPRRSRISARTHLLGRPGQPAELASVYVFLASQESSYVTAEVYGVTGGNPFF